MRKRKIKFTSITTPVGGVSWELKPSIEIELKKIFIFLNSKRILVAPIEESFNRWGMQTVQEKSEPDYVSLSIIQIKDYIMEQQLEKIIDNEDNIRILNEMVSACNDFLDSWESFNKIFMYQNKMMILERDYLIKEYMRIVLYNADVVCKFRKTMKNNVDKLIKMYNIDYIVYFPTTYNKKNFKILL